MGGLTTPKSAFRSKCRCLVRGCWTMKCSQSIRLSSANPVVKILYNKLDICKLTKCGSMAPASCLLPSQIWFALRGRIFITSNIFSSVSIVTIEELSRAHSFGTNSWQKLFIKFQLKHSSISPHQGTPMLMFCPSNSNINLYYLHFRSSRWGKNLHTDSNR